MRESLDQKNSEYGHFSRSTFLKKIILSIILFYKQFILIHYEKNYLFLLKKMKIHMISQKSIERNYLLFNHLFNYNLW